MSGAPGSRLHGAVFVTGNPGKAREVGRILGIEIPRQPVDLPEVQALDIEVVLKAKAEEAWQRLGRPLIVDETGLELEALNGFPGPLIRWLLESIGPEGIARLVGELGNSRVTARCAVLYRDQDCTVVGRGATGGRIVPPRGAGGFGWDSIFQPDGESGTYAELADTRKDEIGHRGKALRDLVETMGGET